MKPFDLWIDFVNKNPKYAGNDYKVFAFGDNPNELVKLVLVGEKTATSSLYSGYKVLPKVGDIFILIDSKGDAKCILQNTKVSLSHLKI